MEGWLALAPTNIPAAAESILNLPFPDQVILKHSRLTVHFMVQNLPFTMSCNMLSKLCFDSLALTWFVWIHWVLLCSFYCSNLFIFLISSWVAIFQLCENSSANFYASPFEQTIGPWKYWMLEKCENNLVSLCSPYHHSGESGKLLSWLPPHGATATATLQLISLDGL